MTIDPEIVAMAEGAPVVIDILAVASSLCSIVVFFVENKSHRKLFAVSCVLGLLMPIYIVAYAAIAYDDEKTIWMSVDLLLRVLFFSPTSFILFIALLRIRAIRHLRVWAGIAIFSTLTIWMGIAALIYALS
jgi:hypothetical protein